MIVSGFLFDCIKMTNVLCLGVDLQLKLIWLLINFAEGFFDL